MNHKSELTLKQFVHFIYTIANGAENQHFWWFIVKLNQTLLISLIAFFLLTFSCSLGTIRKSGDYYP